VQEESPKISVAILAHNEARELAALLASVTFADEVVVADAESTDDTAAVARRAGATVIAVKNDLHFYEKKTVAVNACRGEWIVVLDPDESVTPELAAAVEAAVADGDAPFVAYEFPRRNNYFGKYLKHGGAYPDYQLRLFRRGRARFRRVPIHERLEVDGRVGRLRAPLYHNTYPTVADYLRKLPPYAAASADELERRGVRRGIAADVYYLLLRPGVRFGRRFLFKLGFLDGWPGFLACFLDAAQSVLAYYEFRSRARTRGT
jgi:glycosyltransferase involved in cell wall biosynthesis